MAAGKQQAAPNQQAAPQAAPGQAAAPATGLSRWMPMLGGLALVAWLLLRLERIISPEVNGMSEVPAPTVPVSPSALGG